MMQYRLKTLLIAGLYLSFTKLGESSQKVIKDMTVTFTKPIDTCKKEMHLPDSIYHDFYNLWEEDHVITNRETGCAILCLSTKLQIVDPDLKLHHRNAQEYVMLHGGDKKLARQLVNIIHQCEKTVKRIYDDCLMILEWTKCYKAELHKRNLAPDMNLIVAEMLAEVPIGNGLY